MSKTAPKDPKTNPLSQFATNPHITYVAKEKTWLLYFNGRQWAPNDLTACEPNKTGAAPWHGGGACTSDKDCPGFGYHTDHSQNPGKCVDQKCACEHHSFGLHCNNITETVNVASSLSPNVSKQPCPPARPPARTSFFRSHLAFLEAALRDASQEIELPWACLRARPCACMNARGKNRQR